jgi:hypothetical protein
LRGLEFTLGHFFAGGTGLNKLNNIGRLKVLSGACSGGPPAE